MQFTRYIAAPLLVLLLALGSCKKENIYTYEVNDVGVEQPGAVKPNVKADLEFISIAHTDLFGNTIDPDLLEDMVRSYQSFGDKRLVIDMIILNFLNDASAQIPTDAQMRADTDQFVEDCFRKFLVRDPNEFERWFVKNQIEQDATISPELVYYGFMTCAEYRFY